MPNDSAPTVREAATTDPRVERTTLALGRALIELIQERDFDDITVQSILDRAGVGRTAFYTHYRNKDDVLHSSYERLFAGLEAILEPPSRPRARLFPVAEFLTHVGDSRRLVTALRSAGQMEEMWAACAGYAARIIERRIERMGTVTSGIPRALAARMLAGALVEAIEWWLAHAGTATAAEMDAAFHELARGVLRRPR